MYTIIKSKKKGDSRPFKIVKQDTGQVVGTSKTRKDAAGSIAHRVDYEKQRTAGMKKVITNKNFTKNKGRKKTNNV